MKRESASQSAFFNPRALVALLICGVAASSILSGAQLAFFCSEAPANSSQRTLTFAERVAYQRAIEEVYWRHRIWPKERPDLKPSLDAVITQAQLEKKVADYLRNSQALEDYWHRPITGKRRSFLTNCKPRWSGSPITRGSPECCARSLPRCVTILL